MEGLGMKSWFNNIFKGKTVLVTGHTGFMGSWLCIWLRELGSNVIGYALEPYTDRDNFVTANMSAKMNSNIGDIRDYGRLRSVFDEYHPELVFHMAAQPLVRLSYEQPKLTYDTNIGGTINVLECCRLTNSVKVIINVTSDKCYQNNEWIWGYRENDPLGGYDPYSSSKGCSELITAAYSNCFFSSGRHEGDCKSISSVRAGNIIGGGDWREDRLIPDCVRAIEHNVPIGIRSPRSVRPWQHVLDPLNGYLLLASKMFEEGEKYSGAWNFGPDHNSVIEVDELVKRLLKRWGSGECRDLSGELSPQPHESELLFLDISKATRLLKWTPVLNIDEAIEYTVKWYQTPNVDYDFCVRQIEDYILEEVAKKTPSSYEK